MLLSLCFFDTPPFGDDAPIGDAAPKRELNCSERDRKSRRRGDAGVERNRVRNAPAQRPLPHLGVREEGQAVPIGPTRIAWAVARAADQLPAARARRHLQLAQRIEAATAAAGDRTRKGRSSRRTRLARCVMKFSYITRVWCVGQGGGVELWDGGRERARSSRSQRPLLGASMTLIGLAWAPT